MPFPLELNTQSEVRGETVATLTRRGVTLERVRTGLGAAGVDRWSEDLGIAVKSPWQKYKSLVRRFWPYSDFPASTEYLWRRIQPIFVEGANVKTVTKRLQDENEYVKILAWLALAPWLGWRSYLREISADDWGNLIYASLGCGGQWGYNDTQCSQMLDAFNHFEDCGVFGQPAIHVMRHEADGGENARIAEVLDTEADAMDWNVRETIAIVLARVAAPYMPMTWDDVSGCVQELAFWMENNADELPFWPRKAKCKGLAIKRVEDGPSRVIAKATRNRKF